MPSPEPEFQLFSSLRYDPSLTAHIGTPYYMLSHHRDRLLLAATHFSWPLAIAAISGESGLTHLLTTLNSAPSIASATGPLRVRTLLAKDGALTVESNPVPEIPFFNLYPERLPAPSGNGSGEKETVKVSPLTGGALELGADDNLHGAPEKKVVYDVYPNTELTTPSPYTSYKTTSRDMYTSARQRVGIMDMAAPKEVLIISDLDEEIMEGSLTSVYFWRDGKWVTPRVESGGQIGTTRRWALEKGFCVEGTVRRGTLVEGEECWISNGVRGFIAAVVRLSPPS